MKTAEFDYVLPPERIAQQPLADRAMSRLLVVERRTGSLTHAHVRNLAEYLRAGDLLVLNDTRVIPARIEGVKEGTGGRVGLLLLEEKSAGVWEALCRASGRVRAGQALVLGSGRLKGRLVSTGANGRVSVELSGPRPVMEILEEEGLPPLPPYIRRSRQGGGPEQRARDRERYQTVYARMPGAVAAPTAGLHLTRELLDELERKGIRHVMVTLHVGIGTFKPVSADDVDDHVMEAERYLVSPEAAQAVNAARSARGRIVAVGSTVARTLETACDEQGFVREGEGRTSRFIRPPYRFRAVDAMLTNFHLPRSTLLMMVSALAGRELVRRAYDEAIREGYRFYSYGDCMLIV
jgi:S-adenosylmethionine:tRNA ribosyltransferase-isomerase